MLYGCGGLLGLLLIVIATMAVTLWWIQRPIKPVVLSPKEKAVVQEKLKAAEAAEPAASAVKRVAPQADVAAEVQVPGRSYVSGSRVLRLTEREVNGLLNENTGLGQSVRLEFDQDAINAYLAVPIPKDFPIGGGRMFRARGRFQISLGNGGKPYAVIQDVTVFGLSLPKAWLGGLKGENLLSDAMGQRNGGPVLRGVKDLRVEPGALVLEVQE